MYKCPKCGNTGSFCAHANVELYKWIKFDGDGEIIFMPESDFSDINDFKVLDDVQCEECGYEGPEDEFEE